MTTASAPYAIALLRMRSISKRLCLTMATPIAIHRPSVESETRIATTAELLKNPALNTTAANAAAGMNHFSCSLSTPRDRRYRITTDTTDSNNATTSASTAITIASVAASAHALLSTSRTSRKGLDQFTVATITDATMRTRSIATVLQPT